MRRSKGATLGLFAAVAALILAVAAALDKMGVLPAFIVAGLVGVSMYLLEFWDGLRNPPRDP
jgi:hypothetical protein